MNLDPKTNLPELPKGYFFRVCEDVPGGYYGPRYVVQLRKRRKFWFSKKISEARTVMAADNIRYNATNLQLDLKHNISEASRTASLLGDYPPKRLD